MIIMGMLKNCFTTLLFSFIPLITVSQTITVCSTCTEQSIKLAVIKAEPGDTINVKKGIYFENEIVIEKPVTIIGQDLPTIDGEEKGSIFRVNSDSVVITGFRMKNIGFSHVTNYAAVHIFESSDFTVTNNILENVFFGILVERSKRGEIVRNTISGESEKEFNAGNGIHGWNSSHLLISENKITDLRDGIYLEFVDDSEISENESWGNIRYGLHFMFSNRDKYNNNEFRNNGSGVAVMFSKFISMKGNRFYENWGTASFGLLLKEIYDAEIEGNDFYKNTVGINVEGSTRINYRGNNIRENGWAVKIKGGCYANEFTQNNFSYNSFDLSYNSKMNDNIFIENYWSSYTGYDLDKDGIGDVPFRPVKLFSYIVNRTPETVILLRSFFVDIINFSESVTPVFTPNNLADTKPHMKPFQ